MPSLIGSRITRLEDAPLLRGQGRFIDDIVVPGVLHAGFVRSPHAHAAIRGISKATALDLPGVPNDPFFWGVVSLTLVYAAYVAELEAVAKEIGRSMAEVALNWVANRPGVASVDRDDHGRPSGKGRRGQFSVG
jgi:hypothetical protein